MSSATRTANSSACGYAKAPTSSATTRVGGGSGWITTIRSRGSAARSVLWNLPGVTQSFFPQSPPACVPRVSLEKQKAGHLVNLQPNALLSLRNLERAKGFEPSTPTLARWDRRFDGLLEVLLAFAVIRLRPSFSLVDLNPELLRFASRW